MITGADLLRKMSSGSQEDRRDVLRAVSHLFLERSGAHSERELDLFADILLGLMCGVDDAGLAEVSEVLAPCADAPRRIVTLLGLDEVFSVSGPILEYSPVLTAADLVEIANDSPQPQLAAIARRPVLSPDVTDVLAKRGDRIVLGTVAGNAGAALSDTGLGRLVERGAAWEEVVRAVMSRHDIAEERLTRAVDALPPQIRSGFLNLVPRDTSVAASLLESALVAAAVRRRQEIEEVDAFFQLVHEGLRSLDGCIDDLCRAGRLDDLARLLAMSSNLSEAETHAALTQPNDFALAVLCRSLGVSDQTFEHLAETRASVWSPGAVDSAQSLVAYRAVDVMTAERALRFHKIRTQMI